MAEKDVAAMRQSYKDETGKTIDDYLIAKEPFGNFKHWFDLASKNERIVEPNAMTLATATKDGKPSARPVLMKDFDDKGFVFFTNYCSRKGQELADNPYIALMFFWEPLHQVVRIEGKVEKVSEEESVSYFHTRPRGSQIGALVSKQSSVVASRQVLSDKQKELELQYPTESDVIPKPDYWGGYRVIPDTFEFWKGQANRLHDRIVFRRPLPDEMFADGPAYQGENGWVYERLSP